MNKIKIAPSILSADFANLGASIANLEQDQADYIHIDIMDGHFVPNLTIGPDMVKALRKYSKLPFDTHLMVSNPDYFIPIFANAGSDIITIHWEASNNIEHSIKLIKEHSKKAGISLVPATEESKLEPLLEQLDLVLVMTVNPGFGGQNFISSQLKKIENIRKMIDKINPKIELEVDGGINNMTASQVINAGANVLVSGSYIFNHTAGVAEAIRELRNYGR